MMHSQSPVHNKFFKNQTSLPLVQSLLSKNLPLVGTCTHQGYKDLELPPEAETPPE